ncbi:glycerol-3-phosphate acyltransferase PlsY [Orbus hercynius]|uniref:Glycerol-3-phosphate acyltransferase n=2 Tax=Orbus hercynius TaxID=593135 RepID=A0A495RHP3_9GAMM|nr:glycerol-3-phosphate acyltransferase PlsY [Orbus hercynius]
MLIVAYLCGSLSGAVILSKMLHLPNPSEHGSHNPGATNMLRVNGRLPALAVLFFDMAKGLLPVYFSYRFGVSPFFLGMIAIAACLGHIFPCFFHFHGGKGVATALGAIVMIGLDFSGLLIVTWLISVGLTGYASVGAIVTFLLAPLYVWFIRPELTMPVAMLSCLILVRHHSNIQRLLKGEEPKTFRKKTH